MIGPRELRIGEVDGLLYCDDRAFQRVGVAPQSAEFVLGLQREAGIDAHEEQLFGCEVDRSAYVAGHEGDVVGLELDRAVKVGKGRGGDGLVRHIDRQRRVESRVSADQALHQIGEDLELVQVQIALDHIDDEGRPFVDTQARLDGRDKIPFGEGRVETCALADVDR